MDHSSRAAPFWSKPSPGRRHHPEDMTDEHRMILQTSWDFAEKEIMPQSDRIEKKDAEFIKSLMEHRPANWA